MKSFTVTLFLLVAWCNDVIVARSMEKEMYSIESVMNDKVVVAGPPPCSNMKNWKICKWGCIDDQGHDVGVQKDFVLHKKGKCLSCGCRKHKGEKYTQCLDPHCVPVSGKCKKVVHKKNRCCPYCGDKKPKTTKEPKFTFPPFPSFPNPFPWKK